MKLHLTIITPLKTFELEPANFEKSQIESVIEALKQGANYYQGVIGNKKIIFPGSLLKQSVVLWEVKNDE